MERTEKHERNTLIRAIEENAIEGCREWARWEGLELHETDDLLRILTEVPFPIFNGVLFARLGPQDVDEGIDKVLAPFKEQNLPMAWWIGPSTEPADLGARLQAKGFAHAGDPTGMAADLASLAENLQRPSGLSIEEVSDLDMLRAWSDIMTSVYEFPEFAKRPWFEMHAAMGFGSGAPWRHYVASLDGGQPVATASLFVRGDVASIANVATIQEDQRRGIGAAISLEPLLEAHRIGCRIGTLCSSEMGQGVYRRLGFREYNKMSMYIWPGG